MEEKKKSNDRWQFAFWIITVIFAGLFVTVTMYLGNAVIVNDKERQKEDKRVEREAKEERTDLRLEIQTELKEMNKEQTAIRKEQANMKTDILVAIKALEIKMENNQ